MGNIDRIETKKLSLEESFEVIKSNWEKGRKNLQFGKGYIVLIGKGEKSEIYFLHSGS